MSERIPRRPRPALDLNADLGESFAVYRYGEDEEMMKLITSANVACGFHAGDPTVIRASVQLAAEHGVRIGAHVGLPDRLGFGRRFMQISRDDAYDYTLYQLGALDAFLQAARVPMTHVKPHGALYMMATDDTAIADGIAEAVQAFDPLLEVYALPGSALGLAAGDRGLVTVPEFFADRPYTGSEVQMFGWSYSDIGSPADAAARVRSALTDPDLAEVATICIHSDTVGAPAMLAAVAEVIADADLGRRQLA